MKKITIDFGGPDAAAALSRREIHEYIAEKMDFPPYYGHNLDALYDCLTDICEPTAVGLAIPVLPRNLTEAAFRMKTMTCAGGERTAEAGTGSEAEGRERAFDAMKYFLRVRRTFADAEANNPNLAVFDLMVRIP